MYQQYLNEDRAAQHRQQCEQEAATERSLRASREGEQEGVESSEIADEPLLGAWLQNLGRQVARGLVRNRILKAR
jgi:hypothetical protein